MRGWIYRIIEDELKVIRYLGLMDSLLLSLILNIAVLIDFKPIYYNKKALVII